MEAKTHMGSILATKMVASADITRLQKDSKRALNPLLRL